MIWATASGKGAPGATTLAELHLVADAPQAIAEREKELLAIFGEKIYGFDSDTLETVASTLERLAADSDRMVGVITHVAELAERVPVRFVVNRTGTTSTIVKERT